MIYQSYIYIIPLGLAPGIFWAPKVFSSSQLLGISLEHISNLCKCNLRRYQEIISSVAERAI